MPTPRPAPGESASRPIEQDPATKYIDLPANVVQVCREIARLIDEGNPVTARMLALRLAKERDDVIRQAIISGIAQAEGHPPSVFVPVLIKQLGARTPDNREVDSRLALALGRSIDRKTVNLVIDQATSWLSPLEKRVVAIESLGHYCDKTSAEALVKLTHGLQPDVVREAAAGALAQLSGHDEIGADGWQNWYRQRQHLTDRIWLRDVLEQRHRLMLRQTTKNHRQVNDLLTQARQTFNTERAQRNLAVQRLIQTQETLYRAMAQEQRPALLVTWLNDSIPAVRRLALDLADERLKANRDFDDELRSSLRTQLDDTAADHRRDATLLLWRLADDQTADLIAARLADEREADTGARRAALLMMGDLPRSAAIAPVLTMISAAELRGEAARALTAAIDQNLLTPQQLIQAAERISTLQQDQQFPEPELITLIARVADDRDWQQIELWLDSADPKIKRAAAEAWAWSDDRPLHVLTGYAHDENIQQIVIATARNRGRDRRTLIALIRQTPADDQVLGQWRRALLAMAQRVEPDAIIDADRILAASQDTLDLRESILTVGIDRLAPHTNGGGAENSTLADAKTLVALLLRRAEIRLAADNPKAALGDLRLVEKRHDDVQQEAFVLVLLRAHLGVGELAEAAQVADALILRAPKGRVDKVKSRVAEPFLAAAQQLENDDQRDKAAQVLAKIRQVLGNDVSAGLQSRIDEIDQRLRAESEAPAGETSEG